MNISKLISEHKIFKKKPILLLHIGSAGSSFKLWNNISHNSILVSIDGNNSSNSFKKFKKVINNESIISDKNGSGKFYITNDPHCSSILEPDKLIHKNWYGSHRFKINKVINSNNDSIDLQLSSGVYNILIKIKLPSGEVHQAFEKFIMK